MADFKSILLTLGDDAFFELIRNYLGPIKTPFNKHDLISRLLAFIRRDETQERIISLIDRTDAEILTSIWILDDPTHEDLFAFLESDFGFLDLHNHLLNLEDRLLIYRDGALVRLNPELLPRLRKAVINPGRLFYSTKPEGQSPNEVPTSVTPWVDDLLLISVFSFLLEEPELYRSDGELRKRSTQKLRVCLPELLDQATSGEGARLKIDVIVDALLGLGLVVEDGARVRPVVSAWRRWARQTARLRLADLVGSASTNREGERGDAVLAARAILESGVAGMHAGNHGLARLAAAATGVPAGIASKTVKTLVELAVLSLSKPEAGGVREPSGPDSGRPVVVGANFEVTIPSDIEFADGLFIAEICELLRHDRYPRFELTKDRIASALRSGIAGAHITERLTKLAGGRIPPNVRTSIQSWENEYQSVRLHRGVVLQMHESRRYAVEHSPAIRELMVEELGPGLYLFTEPDVPEVQDALREAGVEMVPELPPRAPDGFVPWQDSPVSPLLEKRIARVSALVREDAGPPQDLSGGATLQTQLERALSSKSLPPDQRQELNQRIQKKLILSPDQLRSGALKAERTEAKGLDYAGKVRVIEHAIAVDEFLEVIERTPEGEPRRSLVEPVSLQKEDNDLFLLGRELPARSDVRLPVSKLGLVRRIRAGLFRRGPGD